MQNTIWNKTFKQQLTRIALGVIDSPELADEIVQEAYMKLVEVKAGSIDNPSHWLFKVTRNLAFDRARRLTRERELNLLLPGLAWIIHSRNEKKATSVIQNATRIDVSHTQGPSDERRYHTAACIVQ